MVKLEEFTDKAGYNRGRKEGKIYGNKNPIVNKYLTKKSASHWDSWFMGVANGVWFA